MNKFISISILTCSFAFAQAQYDPSSDLRQTFCPTQGDFTESSINHTQALRSIVESLQADDNCASIASGTNSLINSLVNLDTLKTDNTELGEAELTLDRYQQEFASYQANFISNFIIQNSTIISGVLTEPSNADIQAALDNFLITDATAIAYSNEVASANLNSIDLQLEYGFSKDDQRVEEKKNKLTTVKNNLSAVLGQLSASSHCTNNNQVLKTNALSLVAGLASTFTTDIVGTAISLGAGLTSSISDLVRTIKTNIKMNKLKRTDYMDSIGCSYLGMAQTYCAAKNAKSLAENRAFLKTSPEKNCKNCSGLLAGLNLKNKKMRVLNNWINSLFASSAPIDLNAATPKTEAEDLRASFAKLKITLSAIFSGARTDLNFATSEQQASNILGSLLSTVYFRILANNGSFSSSSSSSSSSLSSQPYLNLFSQDRDCGPYVYIFSNGLSRTIVRDANTDCLTEVKKVYGDKIFSVDELESVMTKLNLEAQDFVATEVAKSSKVNSQEVLKEFDDLSYGTTPRKVVLELQKYNEDLLLYLDSYKGEKKNLIALIERMNLTYSNALKKEGQLDCNPKAETPKPDTGDETDQDENDDSAAFLPFALVEQECTPDKLATEKISDLGRIFAPSREDLYIQDAFNSILKTHVDIAVERGDITNEELIFLMNDETNNQLDVLSRYALSPSSVLFDTNMAMSKTEENIEVFSGMFDKELYKVLRKLKSKAGSHNEQTFAKLCIASLVSNSNSRSFKKIRYICRGSVVRSLFPREVKHLQYNDSFNKSYEDNICTMFNYNQKLRYVEDRF